MAYTYDSVPVIDPASKTLVANAVGNVYDPTDEAFANPLTVTDSDGNTFTDVPTNEWGVLTQFTCDVARVVWKAGAYSPLTLGSADTYVNAAVAAQTAAEAAQAAAETAAENTSAPTVQVVQSVISSDLNDPDSPTTTAVLGVTAESYAPRVDRTKHVPALNTYFPEAEVTGLLGAIATAAAVSGNVDLGQNTYDLPSLATIPAGVYVQASHPDAVIQLSGAARTAGIRFSGKGVLRGGTIDFQQIPTSYGIQILSTAAGSKVESVQFIHGNGPSTTAVGIKIEADNVRIFDCDTENIATPVQVTGAITGVELIGNTFSGWSQRAIYILGSISGAASKVKVIGNTINPQASVYDVYGPTPTPTQITAYSALSRQPIAFQGSDYNPFRDVSVIGNNVYGLGTSHDDPASPGSSDLISLHQCDGFIVSRNHVYDSGDVGITVATECVNGVVSSNIAMRNDSTGICIGSDRGPTVVSYVRNITVSDNTCMDNGQNRQNDGPAWASNGINIQYADHVTLTGNVCGDTFPDAAWQASHAYATSSIVALGTVTLLATTGGTTGATAPTAPTNPGDTVTDGTVTWALLPSTQTKKTQQYGVAVQNSKTVSFGTNDLTGNALGEIYQASNTGPITLPSSSSAPKIATLAADVTVNNSTTLVPSGLSLNVEANAVYKMEAFLLYNAATAADMDVKFNAPTAATLAWTPHSAGVSTAGPTGVGGFNSYVVGSSGVLGGGGVNAVATPSGLLTTSSTAGTLTLSFAQDTANASDAILRAGSWIMLTRIS